MFSKIKSAFSRKKKSASKQPLLKKPKKQKKRKQKKTKKTKKKKKSVSTPLNNRNQYTSKGPNTFSTKMTTDGGIQYGNKFYKGTNLPKTLDLSKM
tara:strand:- start:199 stop:486 length:288 start_codon:yes stop_codon:yes gene_type:complete